MNGSDYPLPTIPRELFDLLVDGELSEPERRELLLKVDRVPGGWRACAAAFLEAQCLKEACGAIGGQRVADRAPAAVARPRSRISRWVASGLTAMAMAATFLVALGLGWMLRPGNGGAGPGPNLGQIAIVPAGNGGDQGAGGLPGAGRQLALQAGSEPWGTVRVSFPNAAGQPERAISVPVTESDHMDESWFRPAPDTLPADFKAALERLGYQVRQERRLLPVPVEDGSRLVLPVDQVELHRVSKPAY